MTNTFRRHHKTVMWIIIVATIVTFVYYLTPNATRSGGGGGAGPTAPAGTLNGEPVSQPQFEVAMQEAKVAVRMGSGRWPTAQEITQQLPNLAFRQLYIAAKLKEMDLDVPVEATAALTRRIFGVLPGQALSKDEFQKFVKNELNERGKVSEEDFYHWVRDQVGLKLLMDLYGMNGELITAKEVESFFRRDHESMTVELVRFPLTNYTAQIVPTEKDIQDAYVKRQAAYRLPDREQINYIHFNITNYLPAADAIMAGKSNLDTLVEQTYLSREAASWKDEAGNPLSADAAKAKIKEDSRLQVFARQVAQTNALQLIQLFFDGRKDKQDQLITKDELEKFAASNGLTVVTPPAFDEPNPPKELQLHPMYLNMIFQMNTNSPEDQYKLAPATNGFFFLGLDRKLPSENQPLEAVRARVIEDYRNQKAMDLAIHAGTNFEAAVRDGLAKGLSFEEICAEQKIKPQTLTPFSHETKSIPEIQDENEFDYVKGLAYQLPVGQIAPFEQPAADGFVIYLKARTPADESIVERDLPAFLASQRELRQSAAFGIWLNREMQLHAIPAAKPAAAEAPPSSG
ncbi:MAG: SurA N-terminal domain-containing protein [Verrucomicrobiota bacterium]|jgi:hypothetical protein